MAAIKWTTQAWNQIVQKYPKLEGRPEGVAFCAWAMDQGVAGLTPIRDFAKEAGAALKFSGASLGGAKKAMGLSRKKAPKKRAGARRGRPRKAAGQSRPKAGGRKRGRPAKKESWGDVENLIGTLFEDLWVEADAASTEYSRGRDRLQAAKASFKKLRPVFDEYDRARSKKLATVLDTVR